MLLGISSFTFGWWAGVKNYILPNPLTEDNLLQVARLHGLSCIQIGDNLPIHTFDSSRRQKLRQNLANEGIRLELGARGLTAEHLDTYIELAKYFHSPLLRFVIDDGSYRPLLSTVIDIIEDFVPTLNHENIILAIENHDRFKARELVDLMEAIGNRNVGICLDCVNSLGAGEGLDHVVKLLSPYAVNLHIKDFTIERAEHFMGFSVRGTPAGKGMANFPALAERIIKFNRCQSAILEQWVPFQSDLTKTIDLEKKWANESINYLKSIPIFQFQRQII